MSDVVDTVATRTLATAVADLVLGTSLADLPAELLERTKLHVLDQLGAQLVGSTLPTVESIRRYAFEFGAEGPSTVVGHARKLDAEFAGMVNATTGHAFEMDDYAVRASTHPGCEALPAALAVAEESNASGGELLRAVALGFESAVRVGLATMPSMLADRGIHESGPHGAVASALAAGVLRGLSPTTQVMALAIAVSHASGTGEYAYSGGDVKRFHAGLGAMGGIRAVRLAELGLTGPPTILEGKRGFFQVFTERYDAERMTAGWGTTWEFLHYGALKGSFCVASIHAHIAALNELRETNSLNPDDIAEIELGVDPHTIGHVASVGPEPTDIVGAQFSAQFSIALNLVRGANGLDDYEWAMSQDFREPALIALSRRIRVDADPECAGYGSPERPGKLGKVLIKLKDGRELSARAYGKGSPANPMTRDDVEAKYYSLAARRIPRIQAEEVADAVNQLESLDSVRELTALLAAR